MLFEANSEFTSDLYAAVTTAASYAGVSVVSMSWSSSEYSSEQSYDSTFLAPSGHQGVTFLASTGDGGAPGGYPAYSPNVVAVGGTTLTINGDGTYGGETGWSLGSDSWIPFDASSGGISSYESQPAYQTGKVNGTSATQRTIPDVAMDGDPGTGVYVLDSYDFGPSEGWYTVGGTSLACPMWAGLVAIANQGRALNGLGSLNGRTQTLPSLYNLPAADFHDITSGYNGYSAGPGYDLVTGIGSPIANLLVRALAGYATTTHLAFETQPPATVTAGNTLGPALTVYVENASNNVITTDNSSVTLTASGATLDGNTSVQAVNGVATFSNLYMTTAGSDALWAADGTDVGTTSNTFQVNAAAATQVVFTSYPSSLAVGGTFAVQAVVEDQYNNVVPANTSNVTVGLSSGPGTLSGGNCYPLERLLGGITIRNGQLTGQTTNDSVGMIWADAVNAGYNAFLTADPHNGGSYSFSGSSNSYLQMDDPDCTARLTTMARGVYMTRFNTNWASALPTSASSAIAMGVG